jgi:hypothetical protein
VTDLVVLAKAAKEIARTDKDRSRTGSPDQRGFFPKVRIVGGDHGLPACFTKPEISIQPIDPAVPWAKAAGFKKQTPF